MMSQFGTMNNDRKPHITTVAAGLGLLLALGGCVHPRVAFSHAPPGTAVQVAQAKKAEPVPTPTPRPVAAVNPDLPSSRDAQTENIADDYTLGSLMMQQQKYAEAIKAFENVVKLDPTFYDAWNHLAICYQNTGQDKKAIEAFKKYKTLARQQ
jgi:predicted Zn-dependent protease